MGVAAGFMILSYYAVIAGWALNYVLLSAQGTFEGISAANAERTFNEFLANPLELILWHTLFMVLTIWIVGRGISKGLETAIR